MHSHTHFYTRATKRHSHTADGTGIKEVFAEELLKVIPLEDGVRTVYVVTSDRPYVILTAGEDPDFTTDAMSDRPTVLKGLSYPLRSLQVPFSPASVHADYYTKHLRELLTSLFPEHTACTYLHRSSQEEHHVTVDDERTWRDLPPDKVDAYSADWLAVLSGSADMDIDRSS